ncbi:organic cation transporter protein-like [Antedon mediterranea]|uniref:organic cation transporter protein-like n=1 Tax=Antedon mediterranea TaxID=105859 RepID=UPI003AF82F04
MIFDDVFKYIGKYDKYQAVLTHIICLVTIAHTMSNIGTVFLNGSMDHYCKPSDDVITNCTVYECGIEIQVLPQDDDSTAFIDESKCRMYTSTEGNDTHVVKCEHGWNYDQSQYKSTIVSEFDLVCEDRYKVSIAASSYLFGYFFGSIVFGTISDYFGRKRGMIIALTMKVVTGTILSISPSYWFYFVFRVLNGATTIGSYIATFVYVNEIVAPSKRAKVSTICYLYWCIGFLFLALFGFFLRSWRTLYLTISLCPIPVIAVYFFIPESPRWLVLQNRQEEAKLILQKIAKKNKKEFPEGFIEKIQIQQDLHRREWSRKTAIINIFRYPNMRKKSLILIYCWCTVCLAYYGFLYGVESLDISVYLGVALSGIIEGLAVCCALFSIQKFGRRLTLGGLLNAAGIMCFINIWIPSDMEGIRTAVSLGGQCFVTATFYLVYIYTSEIFSTDVRSFGVGLCSLMARVAGMLAPQILYLKVVWNPLPLVTFSVTSVSAGLLAFLLPETLNFPLCQTVEEAELVTRTTNRRKNRIEVSKSNENQKIDETTTM